MFLGTSNKNNSNGLTKGLAEACNEEFQNKGKLQVECDQGVDHVSLICCPWPIGFLYLN